MAPEWIWLVFVFAFGSCVGSFLNVVIYRLPRDESLVSPPSACPACHKHIRFYDNIPLLSWLLLRGRCRYCKVRISPRYFVVELMTALIFVAMFVLYFVAEYRQTGIGASTPIDNFVAGGWLFYVVGIVMLSAFLAASAIDLELWVIPLSICWFVTVTGLLAATLAGYVIEPKIIWTYRLFPSASPSAGALAAGAAVGLAISLVSLGTGIIKRSYEWEQEEQSEPQDGQSEEKSDQPDHNHRLEVLREVVFLLPIIVCACVAFFVTKHISSVDTWWSSFSQVPVVTGFLGSLWGYFVGCAVVWATRILGTLAFGKEAMGLGDVHLMGAAGAVIGPFFVIIAFFIAPFFGLTWAAYQTFFKKTRQIPYGPFLSLAVFTVMIYHDWILGYWSNFFLYSK